MPTKVAEVFSHGVLEKYVASAIHFLGVVHVQPHENFGCTVLLIKQLY